jgi:hypothetical protein
VKTINFGDERLPAKVWDRVHPCPMTGCWLWAAGLSDAGYGTLRRDGKNTLAHRLSFESLVGDIPDGLCIDHLCRVRCCINPAHMEPVTMRENVLRGISMVAVNARKTHCHAGHPFEGENLIVTPNGRRCCRECQNAGQRRRYEKGRPERERIAALNPKVSTCKRGHAWTEENTRISNGKRRCLNCRRDYFYWWQKTTREERRAARCE